jgi:hypothetical protein
MIIQTISQNIRTYMMFHNKITSYDEEKLVQLPKTQLHGHLLSAITESLFSTFAANLHIRSPSLLHPQPEEEAYFGEKRPIEHKLYLRGASIISGTGAAFYTKVVVARCNGR